MNLTTYTHVIVTELRLNYEWTNLHNTRPECRTLQPLHNQKKNSNSFPRSRNLEFKLFGERAEPQTISFNSILLGRLLFMQIQQSPENGQIGGFYQRKVSLSYFWLGWFSRRYRNVTGQCSLNQAPILPHRLSRNCFVLKLTGWMSLQLHNIRMLLRIQGNYSIYERRA